jgi:hypothetical protein
MILADRPADRLDQLSGHHRLGQYRVERHAFPLGFAEGFLAAVGGDHDRRRNVQHVPGMEQAQRLDAVHHGHLPVDQHQVEGPPALFRLGDGMQRGRAVAGRFDLKAKAVRDGGGDLARRLVVVDHQHAGGGRHAGGGAGRRLRLHAEARGEVEYRSPAGFAVHPDAPAHQLDQRLARSPGPGRCRRSGASSSCRPG